MLPGTSLQELDPSSLFLYKNAGGGLGALDGEFIYWWADSATVSTTVSQFMAPGHVSAFVTDNERRFWRVPRAGIIRNLAAYAKTPGSGPGTTTFVFEVNSVDSLLQTSVLSAANPFVAADDVNQIIVAAGDRVSMEMKWTTAVGVTGPSLIAATVLYRAN